MNKNSKQKRSFKEIEYGDKLNWQNRIKTASSEHLVETVADEKNYHWKLKMYFNRFKLSRVFGVPYVCVFLSIFINYVPLCHMLDFSIRVIANVPYKSSLFQQFFFYSFSVQFSAGFFVPSSRFIIKLVELVMKNAPWFCITDKLNKHALHLSMYKFCSR